LGLVDQIECGKEKWDLSSRYNTLDQDYEIQYIDGIKFFYKISEKFSPVNVQMINEFYDEKELQIELPKDENDDDDYEDEIPKPSNITLQRI
jgi:hypothetical protein